MKEENQTFCGVVTFEQPFSIHRDGVAFRDRLALKTSANVNRETCDEIAKCLNVAFQEGFDEGVAEMSKMFKNLKK